MSETEALMRAWLRTGTPVQKAHAEARIAIGFADGPAPVARRPGPSAWLSRVNTCPWRECQSGCQASQCHWRRDDFGRPLIVSLSDCTKCMGRPGLPPRE